MWNEIWNFVKDNIGWVLVGAVGLIILLKKYIYDKWKKRKFEKDVPSIEPEQTSMREQPDYTPLFKDKTDDLSNLDTQIKKAKRELARITNEGKKLEMDEDTLERWNVTQGKIYVSRQDLITLKGKRINDKYSFYVNQLKGLEQLKLNQEKFLGERGK